VGVGVGEGEGEGEGVGVGVPLLSWPVLVLSLHDDSVCCGLISIKYAEHPFMPLKGTEPLLSWPVLVLALHDHSVCCGLIPNNMQNTHLCLKPTGRTLHIRRCLISRSTHRIARHMPPHPQL